MSKNLFGIMQGRLLPKYQGNFQAHPVGYWQDEFKIASKLGFDCIEFILDYRLFNSNPLLLETGLDKIKSLSKKNNVSVRSVCADYFMDSPIFLDDLVKKKQNLDTLKKLLLNATKISITDIIIPLVDNSSVLQSKKKAKLAVNFFKNFFDLINCENINICLETDLPPKHFLEFVNNIDHPQIKINYDTGNSASLGYDFFEEFETYGHLVTNIHIKDRKLNGKSVALGLGECNFKEIFKYLCQKNYDGIFILQAFRGDDGLSSLIPQYKYIKNYIEKYFYKES
jgi:L-ribulose-5-phosphate 3-epimerase